MYFLRRKSPDLRSWHNFHKHTVSLASKMLNPTNIWESDFTLICTSVHKQNMTEQSSWVYYSHFPFSTRKHIVASTFIANDYGVVIDKSAHSTALNGLDTMCTILNKGRCS